MKQLYVFIATLAMVITSYATADDASAGGGAPSNWSRYYLGASVGFDTHWADFQDIEDNFDNEAPNGNRKINFNGGLYVGKNWQVGRGVFGVEFDWNRFNSTSESIAIDTRNSIHSKLRQIISLRFRAGIALDENLLFVAVGPAFGKFKFTINDDGDLYHKNDNVLGLSLVAGYERQISKHWSWRVQTEAITFKTSKEFTPFADGVFTHSDTFINATFGIAYNF